MSGRWDSLFDGPATNRPRPQLIPRGIAFFRPDGEFESPPVTHVRGYDRFADWLQSRSLDPSALARRPSDVVSVVYENAGKFRKDRVLRQSAAVFLGNALCAVRPVASWQNEMGPWMVGDSRQSFSMLVAIERLAEDPTDQQPTDPDEPEMPVGDELVRGFSDMLDSWVASPTPNDDPLSTDEGRVADVEIVSAGYARSPQTEEAIRADQAKFPPRDREPTADEYSAAENFHRYAPVGAAVDDLVNFLAREFDVEVADELDDSWMELRRSRPGVPTGVKPTKTVCLRPSNPQSAPICVEWLDSLVVTVQVGLFSEVRAPTCGCDACDESLGDALDHLETHVFTVVGGGFTELIDATGTCRSERWLSTQLTTSGTDFEVEPPADLESVRERLELVSDGWAPWPRRAK